MTASVVKSRFSKVAKTSVFCNSVKKCMVCSEKVTLLEISGSLLAIGVAGLQYTVCNATRNELLTKFLKGILKHIENFQEVVFKRFLIRNMQSYKLHLLALRDFKTPEITPTVEFLS